jgi:hypothetical protein
VYILYAFIRPIPGTEAKNATIGRWQLAIETGTRVDSGTVL